ncbi:DUF305 domain-containing protein [Nocardioides rotundus]|uniref:DUF305 domain-containing protein n=1 Tax=Nocardioides rotundus TaxID=1774216 RepID=UPI001CC02FB4|nr:DUF305 domain-containing protein [Nocardioides rotundus]UAL30771.1 DUF305 domain-containing protein [Nocardioides rotundus]
MSLRRTSSVLASTALALGLLAGCGNDEDGGGAGGSGHSGHSSSQESSSPGSSQAFNDADVDFATMMIPHHAQALSMVDLTQGRPGLSPEFVDLTEQIRAAQAPEIEQMSGWLRAWGQPVPEEGMGHDMAGGMTEQDMSRLEKAPDARFEDMWLEMMIRHHEGAVAMARDEVERGKSPEATKLAQEIVGGQQAEIEQMRGMLKG